MQLDKQMVDKTSWGWFMLPSWCVFNHCFVYYSKYPAYKSLQSSRQETVGSQNVSELWVCPNVCVCVSYATYHTDIYTKRVTSCSHIHDLTFRWSGGGDAGAEGCPAREYQRANFLFLISHWLPIKEHCFIALLEVHHDLTFSIKEHFASLLAFPHISSWPGWKNKHFVLFSCFCWVITRTLCICAPWSITRTSAASSVILIST